MSVISGIGDSGLYVGGLLIGPLYDAVGPRLTFGMAALLLYLGYALMYLATVDMVSSHYVAMGFYFLFAGLGSSAGYQAGLITNIRNFTPKLRGIVTGLLAAAFGLSAAVFTKIYGSFWKETAAVDQFLWFLAVCLGLLPLVGYLAVYLLPPATQPTLGEEQGLLEGETETPSEDKKPIAKYGEITGLQMMKTLDFWLLWLTECFVSGAGLAYINIVGEVIRSNGITEIASGNYVIALSISNCLGRLILGILADVTRTKVISVTYLLPCGVLILIGHSILLWTTNAYAAMIATICTGLAYGGTFSIVPITLNRYFGDKHYGQNLGWTSLSVAVGGLGMGYISGAIYDSLAPANPPPLDPTLSTAPESVCYGLICYRYTWIMTLSAALLGLLANGLLVRREIMWDRQKYKVVNAPSFEE